MAPDLTTHSLPPRSRTDRAPRWEVRYGGQLIGSVEEKRIGKSSSTFYQAFALIGGRNINLELDIDFAGRCDAILQAWHHPSSNVHVRYALNLPDPE